jgi:hypothetical protein
LIFCFRPIFPIKWQKQNQNNNEVGKAKLKFTVSFGFGPHVAKPETGEAKAKCQNLEWQK